MTTDLVQRSPEWFAARCGKLTASRIGEIVKRTQTGLSAKRVKYLEQLVAERLTGVNQNGREVRSLSERSALEPKARAAYSFYSGNEVRLVGFVPHPTIPLCGSSPDGLVNDDGTLEIKVLDATTHSNLLAGDFGVIDEYIPQIQFGLACSGRQWSDFESYQPAMPENLRVFIKRIPRDEKEIAKLEAAARDFLAEVEQRVQKIRERSCEDKSTNRILRASRDGTGENTQRHPSRRIRAKHRRQRGRAGILLD